MSEMEDMSRACFQPITTTLNFLFNDITHIAEETWREWRRTRLWL